MEKARRQIEKFAFSLEKHASSFLDESDLRSKLDRPRIDLGDHDRIDTGLLIPAIRLENALQGEISAQVYKLMRVGLRRLIVRACAVDFRSGFSMFLAIWSLMASTRRLIFAARFCRFRRIGDSLF